MTDYNATPLPASSPAEAYKLTKTISKAAPPLVLIIIIQFLKGTLSGTNVHITDDVIYSAALALYGGYIGLVNWIKNRKRGATA